MGETGGAHRIDLSEMSRSEQMWGRASAVAAAVLFGVSAPLAKLLLPGIGPLMLAGLLYLGAGLGLAVVGVVRRGRGGTAREAREAPLRRADFALIAGIVLSGGVAAPVLMLVGLERVSAVVGSLLLNLEAPLTILLAVVLFGEHLGAREAAAALLVAAGAALLAYAPGDLRAAPGGVLAVGLACLGWAIDNNLTQRLSLRDPVAVVRMKGLVAGTLTIAVALGTRSSLPPASRLVSGLVLGLVSYGLSVVLAIRAMRALGAARQAAFFAAAPFIGALVAVPVLGETLGLRELLAGGVMAVGLGVLVTEQHRHSHVHESLDHEHAHVHDEHHRHEHGSEVGPEPHAHRHVHPPLSHAHPHVSDAHHRHKH